MSRRYVALRQWRSAKRFNSVAIGPYSTRSRAATAARRAQLDEYLSGDFSVALLNTTTLWHVRPKPNHQTGEYGMAVVQAYDLTSAMAAFEKAYPDLRLHDFEFRELPCHVGNAVVAAYFE